MKIWKRNLYVCWFGTFIVSAIFSPIWGIAAGKVYKKLNVLQN